jgi:hypothetical protein
MTTQTDLHVSEIPAVVDDLEARILADTRKAVEDRGDTLRWIAEGVVDEQPFLASTGLDIARPLCTGLLDDDTFAARFGDLVEAVRDLQALTGGADWQDHLASLGFAVINHDTYASVEERLAGEVAWCVRRLLDLEAPVQR